MYLFVDAESTDLIKEDLPPSSPEQPWLVQVGADLSDQNGKTTGFLRRYVRLPENASVRPGAEAVHGISTRQARRHGATQRWALYGILEMMNEARFAISYGRFDRDLGASLIQRIGGSETGQWLQQWSRPGLEWINLITTCSALCKIPGEHFSGGFKWPSLDVACEVLLGEAPREAEHDSWDDCQRLKRLFFALKERNALELDV